MEDASTVDPAVALGVSLLALAVAIAAAGFTGWQAWVAHLTRADGRRVLLGLRMVERSDGFRDRARGLVENGDKGEAVNIDVTFTFEKGENVHAFRSRVGVLPSLGSVPLIFADREPPNLDSRLSGSETERVRDFTTASASYSLGGVASGGQSHWSCRPVSGRIRAGAPPGGCRRRALRERSDSSTRSMRSRTRT